MHCTDAPCLDVCPTNCIYHTEDGIVLHNKDQCIGCGYCSYACPFGDTLVSCIIVTASYP